MMTRIGRFKWLLVAMLLMLLVVGPVVAQDETPEVDVTPSQEVATPHPLTPSPHVERRDTAPIESVDNHTWVDDFLESPLAIMLGVAVILGIFQINRPQTVEQYETAKADIARQRQQAQATETPYDDWLVEAREVLNELRRRQEASEANPIPPSQPPSQTDDAVGVRPVVTVNLNHPPDTVVGVQQPDATLWVPVNPNWGLGLIGENGLAYTENDSFGRVVAVPHEYHYSAQPDMIDGIVSPHPDTFYKANRGFEMALAHKAGRFGYHFLVDKPLRRFAVVVEYEARLHPERGDDGNHTAYLVGSIDYQGKKIAVLAQTPVLVERSSEAQWLFEATTPYDELVVEVRVYMPYAALQDNSTFLWKRIKCVPVPDDYGDNVVVRI